MEKYVVSDADKGVIQMLMISIEADSNVNIKYHAYNKEWFIYVVNNLYHYAGWGPTIEEAFGMFFEKLCSWESRKDD